METMTLLSLAFSLFLLMDSIGNIPCYITFLKHIPPKRQSFIIFREMIIALLIIVLFMFLGDGLMLFLHIEHDTLQIAGGIILFLICLKMIFPPATDSNEKLPKESEPFIVPLAIPLIAGPSVLATVIIYAKQVDTSVLMGAILISWAASLLVLLSSSILQKILGWKGIIAIERLMGLVLALIAIQMFLSGISSFIKFQCQ
jgi:multiple antibiotic resistance protein